MALRMRLRVSTCTPGSLLMTRETVFADTSARSATSWMVTERVSDVIGSDWLGEWRRYCAVRPPKSQCRIGSPLRHCPRKGGVLARVNIKCREKSTPRSNHGALCYG